MDIKTENPESHILKEDVRHTPLPDHLLTHTKPQGQAETRWRSTSLVELHSLTQEEWTTLNDILAKHNSYKKDSVVTRYVQERLNNLTDGGKAEVVIIHNDERNAFAVSGLVVINDGMLKAIDFEEQLDALLAHEWVHIREEHVVDAQTDRGFVEEIGRSRIHETEADILALELLDRKGINIKGMTTLFDKIDSEVQEERVTEEEERKKSKKKKTSPFEIGDVTHGSLLDRRVNMDELLLVLDVRNIAGEDQLTPLKIQSIDLEAYQRDSELWERYNELEPAEKRRFLQRQLTQKLRRPIEHTNEKLEPEDLQIGVQQLTNLHKQLIRDEDPTLTEQQVNYLTNTIIEAGYGLRLYEQAFAEGFTTQKQVIDFFKTLTHKSLSNLGITLHEGELTRVGAEVLRNYLISQSELDLSAYSNLLDEITPYFQSDDFLWKPIIDSAQEKGLLSDPKRIGEIGSFIAMADVFLLKISDYLHSLQENMDFYNKHRLLKSIGTQRLKIALAIDDPVEFFRYIAKYDDSEYFSVQFLRDTIDERKEYEIWGKHEIDLIAQDNSDEQDRTVETEMEVFEAEESKEYNEDGGFDDLNEILEYEEEQKFRNTQMMSENMINIRLSKLVKNTPISDVIEDLSDYASQNDLKTEDLKFTRVIFEEYAKRMALGSFRERLTLMYLFANKRSFLTNINAYFEEYESFSPEDLDPFLNAILSISSDSEAKGFPKRWEITRQDIDKIRSLKDLGLRSYLQAANNSGNTQLIVEMIKKLPVARIRRAGVFAKEEEFNTAVNQWENILEMVLRKKDILQDNDALLELVALGLVSDNVQVNLQIPSAAMEQIIKNVSFDVGIDLIFNRFSHLPSYVFSQALEHLIEQKANTLEEFALLEQMMRRNIERFLDNEDLVGRVSLADGLLIENLASIREEERRVGIKRDEIKGLESTRLLKALLDTAHGDVDLKEYLFDKWWLRYRTDLSFRGENEVSDFFKIEDIAYLYHPGKEARFSWWSRQVPESASYKPLSEIVGNVYLSSTAMKYYVLRKILIGNNGVLKDDLGRQQLLNAFTSAWLDFGDSQEAERVVNNLLESLFTVTSQEDLYQRINPILLDLILRPPESSHGLSDIAFQKAHNELLRMHDEGLIKKVTTRERDFLQAKIMRLMTGGADTEEVIVSNNVTRLLELFTEKTQPNGYHKFTPLELATTVGEKSGAVGVRMLQLAGQYFDIPEGEREKFSSVYDQMKGQTRLQAYRVLKREAEHSKAIASFMDEVDEILPRIGGGSLMTVYEALRKDGGREALAVKNPNAEYHVARTIDIFGRAVSAAREKDPNNENYLLIQSLLSDAEIWIIEELTDPTFEEKDALFYAQNDATQGAFNNDNNTYEIQVPKSIPTGTRWVRRDEFIDGKNLTRLKVSDGQTNIPAGVINREDYKQAISLLVRNYVYQLTETGLVHSDIHPGNFRITPDNKKVAVFDRYNLLELDDAQRTLISGFVKSFAGGGIEQTVRMTMDYLFGLDENGTLKGDKNEILEKVLESTKNSNLEGGIINAIVGLKQRGVFVPITVTLIVKNLFALNQMAKGAGFNGIADAYTSTANQEDIMKLLNL